MRRAVTALALVAALAGAVSGPGPEASAAAVDAVLGDVNGSVITLSDVALARALGLFGFDPSDAPVGPPDLERMVDARLVERETARLEIGGAAAVGEAWQAVAARAGGVEALVGWLEAAGVDLDWARQMVESDMWWRRFIDVRFRAFVFVADTDVSAALGTVAATPEARERMRQRLIDEVTQRDLSRWLEDARSRAQIRVTDAVNARLPLPFEAPGPTR
ncbi:MAG TPA: hypothetical protein VLG48_01585 [Candidatus Methylomirabilis sp.]|nr:hypothetical protein [Candidatus Methylomirabilis sp.]